MKRIFIAASLLMFAASTFAFKPMVKKDVSYFSQRSFYENFGNIKNVTWKSTAQFDEAVFLKDGISFTAFFNQHGDLVGTTHQIQFSDLPAVAQKEIRKHYGKYPVLKVIDFDDNEANNDSFMIGESSAIDTDHYFVVLGEQNNKDLFLEVSREGEVSYFTETK